MSLIERVDMGTWNKAQDFELDYWKTYIQNPDVEWLKWSDYFLTHFEKEIKADYSDNTLLEIGTGPVGIISKLNAKRRIGVEPLADDLKSLNNDIYQGMEMISHGAESIPEVEENSVDAIFCFNVLDHVQDATDVLNEIYRVCKKDGKIILACDLKSQPHHLDVGHPIALSYEYFINWIESKSLKTLKLEKVKSRSVDSNNNDMLDGTIIFVGQK